KTKCIQEFRHALTSSLEATSLRGIAGSSLRGSYTGITPGLRGAHWGRQGVTLSLVGLFLTALLSLLGLPVEEQVHHHVPRIGGGDLLAHLQDHTRQQPIQHANRVLALVVGRDGHIHVIEGAVRIAEGDRRDVHVGRLLHRLVVRAGIGEDKQAR
ncbi:hypothetical protein Vretimale_2849, partial [Volvox reticuliferus]